MSQNRISAAGLRGGVPSTARLMALQRGPLPDPPPTTCSRHCRAARLLGRGKTATALTGSHSPDAHRQGRRLE